MTEAVEDGSGAINGMLVFGQASAASSEEAADMAKEPNVILRS